MRFTFGPSTNDRILKSGAKLGGRRRPRKQPEVRSSARADSPGREGSSCASCEVVAANPAWVLYAGMSRASYMGAVIQARRVVGPGHTIAI